MANDTSPDINDAIIDSWVEQQKGTNNFGGASASGNGSGIGSGVSGSGTYRPSIAGASASGNGSGIGSGVSGSGTLPTSTRYGDSNRQPASVITPVQPDRSGYVPMTPSTVDYTSNSGGGGGGGAPAPRPAAPVDTRTQAQKDAEFYAAYNSAIDKAIAGDPTEMKNLDKFFFSAERPPIGYTPEYLQLERRAKAAGVSIDQQQTNENMSSMGTSFTLIQGDGPNTGHDPIAGNGAAVYAVNDKGERFHITGAVATEMINRGIWSQPVVRSQAEVDSMVYKKQLGAADDLKAINNIELPPMPEPIAPIVSSGTPLVPQTPEPEVNQQEEEEKARVAAAEEEQKQKEAEDHAKAAAAQAEADEKQQQALAVATASKKSAREDRMRKINEMRKPWMGGAASSSSGSDAMVVPPITPASQVPPPPFQ